MKIIETNITYDIAGSIVDHQSRVISTCKNWDEYIS